MQTRFLIAVLLQVVILFALVLFKTSVLYGGTEVLLRTEPVDPRDLLRGDYVVFQYQDFSFPSVGGQFNNGATVYAELVERRGYGEFLSLTTEKPPKDSLYLKGTVVSGGTQTIGEPFDAEFGTRGRLHVKYGIEEYFIPEGTGRGVNFRNNEVAVQVVIDENGNAVAKGVFVDGEEWP